MALFFVNNLTTPVEADHQFGTLIAAFSADVAINAFLAEHPALAEDEFAVIPVSSISAYQAVQEVNLEVDTFDAGEPDITV